MPTRRFVLSSGLSSMMPFALIAGDGAARPELRDDGWPVASPASAGLDPAALEELVRLIDAGVTFANVHAVLIAHRGRLVFEHYRPGEDWRFAQPLGRVAHGPATLHDIRSITKSVTSLLLGVALGKLADSALQRPIESFFRDNRPFGVGLREVTLHHVLTMTAGLEWNETLVPYDSARNAFTQLMQSSDPVDFVLSRAVGSSPGLVWTYNSGLTELVAGVIEAVTGRGLHGFAKAALFGPLAFGSHEWVKSPTWPEGHFPSAGGGLRLSARDLAKIGALVEQRGVWQGKQVVPAAWIERSTRRHVQDVPWGPVGAYGYGYFWFPGRLLGGAQVIRASGYGDQRLYVVPETGLSVAILAGNYDRGSRGIGERIMGRIMRALV